MRRPSAAVVLALCLLVTALPALTVAPAAAAGGVTAPGDGGDHEARLHRIDSPTLRLRDLFVALPSLEGEARQRARSLLARPTQGPRDPNGDGYTVPSRKTCSDRICVHWVPRTRDAPPDKAWVRTTLRVMKQTWAREVGDLGYRPPVRDGRRGGNAKFDVYLKDVGAQGFYGYCAPERRQRGWRWRASGYCVLDDDFARSQFGAKPIHGLRVTAAHEFFHALQFGYDYAEDRWLMEGTATWIEERVADGVDDNRQYLRYGQVRRPARPLDRFDPAGFDQYGNWAFFEYLSTRWDDRIVRTIWTTAQDVKDRKRDPYSTQAVKRALPRGLGFPELYRGFAAANTVPGRSYPEGDTWPSAPSSAAHTLAAKQRSAAGTLRLDHLAARHVAVRPGDGLRQRGWRLRVTVDGPPRATGPAAVLLVHGEAGSLSRKVVALDRDGHGRLTTGFSSRSIRRATLTLANASTRFRCWRQQETYSCQGTPRDDGRRFTYRLRLLAP